MDTIYQTLKLRTQHLDPDVRQIAAALSEHLRLFPTGWVAQALHSPQMSVYKSPLEKVLILEKIVIHHFLQDFWLSAISHSKIPSDQLTQLHQNYARVSASGWLQLVINITPSESSLIIGKPIQTNRMPRYHNLFKKVILPLLHTYPHTKLTVVDAGSSSGIGSHAAKYHKVPVQTWIGVDKEDHQVNLPWILTCSSRISEITSNTFPRTLKLMHRLPKNTHILRGDIENLPQSLETESVDLYLAVFSFYQLQHPHRAFTQALRILKPGGFFVITDYLLRTGPRTYRLTSPTPSAPLLSLAFKKDSQHQVQLLNIHQWHNTDLTHGATLALPANHRIPTKIIIRNSHP